MFCCNHISYLLESCVLLSNWRCYFLLQSPSADADDEHPAGNGEEPAELRGRAGKDGWRFVVFFFCACEVERRREKKNDTRSDGSVFISDGWQPTGRKVEPARRRLIVPIQYFVQVT